MTAYVISKVRMRPGPALDRYRELAAASIARHGGRYLVRGGAVEVLEGAWDAPVVILAFDSADQARAWYRSDDYAEALRHGDEALERDLIIVEGVDA